MIQKVLSAPLETAEDHFNLKSICPEKRINEMEFYFPLLPVKPQTLKRIFSDYGGLDIPTDISARLGKFTFSAAKGFMKGYIDMICQNKGRYYLVDWKSNFLGSQLADYDKYSLKETMKEELYILQYHLYTLALHQYLRIRIPEYRYESNFGGVFYIFIRGVDPGLDLECGIYKDFPARDLIHALGRSLIPGF